ncbi:MAG TPA: M28 family peptidase, partial [Pyrinomonadaceae bacterium]|nr:M28 family peptidase [Pyrinomonadaceae bacterium]
MRGLLLLLALVASGCAAEPAQVQGGRAEATPTPAATPSRPAAGARQLLEDVRALSSDEMQGREAGTEGAAKARAYIAGRFREAGLKPLWGDSFEQPFDLPAARGGKKREGVNLVGVATGKTRPERLLVVTAHYDHLGARGGQVFNGADDNASGVAVLLQLAAHFARERPENSMVFAALDAEEAGLLGAEALARKLTAERRDVALNVNLDMVSRSDRGELYAAGAHHYPRLRPLLEQVAARAPVKLLLGHDRPEQGDDDWTTQSDQGAFHRRKIPFVYFGVENHKDYHRPTDDFEAVNRDFFVKAAETILDAVETL